MPIILQEIHSTELDQWLRERHYLHSVPAGSRLRLEFLDDSGARIGAMLWGRPAAARLNQTQLLQLSRMYFVEDTESFVESRALGMARRYIRRHFPQVHGLITYASTEQGHAGTVHLADGWFQVGTSRSYGKGWGNREGRSNQDTSAKLVFVRSP